MSPLFRCFLGELYHLSAQWVSQPSAALLAWISFKDWMPQKAKKPLAIGVLWWFLPLERKIIKQPSMPVWAGKWVFWCWVVTKHEREPLKSPQRSRQHSWQGPNWWKIQIKRLKSKKNIRIKKRMKLAKEPQSLWAMSGSLAMEEKSWTSVCWGH